jgi:hypothetical protein
MFADLARPAESPGGRLQSPRASARLLCYRQSGGIIKSETIPVQQVFQDRRQYLVPLSVIDEVVKKITDQSITEYEYDLLTATLKRIDATR